MTMMKEINNTTDLALATIDFMDLIEDRPYEIEVIWLDDLHAQTDEARRIAEALREQVASMNLEEAVDVTQHHYNRVTISKKD